MATKFDLEFNQIDCQQVDETVGLDNDMCEALFEVSAEIYELNHTSIKYQEALLEAYNNFNGNEEVYKSEIAIVSEGFLGDLWNGFVSIVKKIISALRTLVNKFVNLIKKISRKFGSNPNSIRIGLLHFNYDAGNSFSYDGGVSQLYLKGRHDFSAMCFSIVTTMSYFIETLLTNTDQSKVKDICNDSLAKLTEYRVSDNIDNDPTKKVSFKSIAEVQNVIQVEITKAINSIESFIKTKQDDIKQIQIVDHSAEKFVRAVISQWMNTLNDLTKMANQDSAIITAACAQALNDFNTIGYIQSPKEGYYDNHGFVKDLVL